ncbi:recombinase RecT [Nocardia fluminea]|uniref:recombinase RecT n=1 Tax=Nocardia fluminea TaxID=134984 RepID=UPI00366561C4
MTESIIDAASAAKSTPASLITRHRADFASVLPPTMTVDRWVRLAISAVNADDKLAEIFRRDRGASLMRALMRCATLGHEPGGGLFHLVPKGASIEGWEDYKGIIQRIQRSALYSKVIVEAVYENDEYEFDQNVDERPRHIKAKGDRGKPVSAYAYAVQFQGGAISKVAEATKEMIAASKAKSRGSDNASSPWNSPAAPMHRKVAVRELEKFVSTSALDLRVTGGMLVDLTVPAAVEDGYDDFADVA